MAVNSLSTFFWNISPSSATPNSGLKYQNLPNGQENVIKHGIYQHEALYTC